MAEPAGFEPANAGTKTQCLTTWRRLNLVLIISLFYAVVHCSRAKYITRCGKIAKISDGTTSGEVKS